MQDSKTPSSSLTELLTHSGQNNWLASVVSGQVVATSIQMEAFILLNDRTPNFESMNQCDLEHLCEEAFAELERRLQEDNCDDSMYTPHGD